MPLAKVKAGSPVFINRGSSCALHLGSFPRVKMGSKTEYAGMMELADMQDLGDVTSVKVFPVPGTKNEYAPVAKMVYAADLGDVTSGKVFRHAAGKGKSRFACFYKSWIKLCAPPRELSPSKNGK